MNRQATTMKTMRMTTPLADPHSLRTPIPEGRRLRSRATSSRCGGSASGVQAVLVGPAAAVGRQVDPERSAVALGGAGGALDDRGESDVDVAAPEDGEHVAGHECLPPVLAGVGVTSMTVLHAPHQAK